MSYSAISFIYIACRWLLHAFGSMASTMSSETVLADGPMYHGTQQPQRAIEGAVLPNEAKSKDAIDSAEEAQWKLVLGAGTGRSAVDLAAQAPLVQRVRFFSRTAPCRRNVEHRTTSVIGREFDGLLCSSAPVVPSAWVPRWRCSSLPDHVLGRKVVPVLARWSPCGRRCAGVCTSLP